MTASELAALSAVASLVAACASAVTAFFTWLIARGEYAVRPALDVLMAWHEPNSGYRTIAMNEQRAWNPEAFWDASGDGTLFRVRNRGRRPFSVSRIEFRYGLWRPHRLTVPMLQTEHLDVVAAGGAAEFSEIATIPQKASGSLRKT